MLFFFFVKLEIFYTNKVQLHRRRKCLIVFPQVFCSTQLLHFKKLWYNSSSSDITSWTFQKPKNPKELRDQVMILQRYQSYNDCNGFWEINDHWYVLWPDVGMDGILKVIYQIETVYGFLYNMYQSWLWVNIANSATERLSSLQKGSKDHMSDLCKWSRCTQRSRVLVKNLTCMQPLK